MTDIYCVKCKTKPPTLDVKNVTTKITDTLSQVNVQFVAEQNIRLLRNNYKI